MNLHLQQKRNSTECNKAEDEDITTGRGAHTEHVDNIFCRGMLSASHCS